MEFCYKPLHIYAESHRLKSSSQSRDCKRSHDCCQETDLAFPLFPSNLGSYFMSIYTCYHSNSNSVQILPIGFYDLRKGWFWSETNTVPVTSITPKICLDLQLHWMAQQHIIDSFTTPRTPRHFFQELDTQSNCVQESLGDSENSASKQQDAVCVFITVTGHWRLCAYVWQNQYCFLSGSKWKCKVKDYHRSKFSDADQREHHRWHVVMWRPRFCVTCSIRSTKRSQL